jgi:NAD(P)-dependent dehydrogenase (short-subunit alcohol dehydrogenase family)
MTATARRWIITGGSRGVGLATAKLALERGDKVAVIARGLDPVAMRKELGRNALAFKADVSDATSVANVATAVVDAWGGVDVLVNNAGLHRGGKVDKLSLEDWHAVLAVNLSGALHCVRAVLPHMGAGGSIINVGAVVGFRGFPGDSPYGASKAGLAGLTQVLAIELAKRQIRVNLVIPGWIETEMTAGLSATAREKLIARIPMRRAGTEREIGDVIWWVAGSTYMTGAIIPTDGGLMSSF